jgi:hypothetical protein
VANLSVFIFVMTGVVYETQHRTNSNIASYADALYFMVTALFVRRVAGRARRAGRAAAAGASA